MNIKHRTENKVDNDLLNMLGQTFSETEKGVRPCWSFCRKIIRQIGGSLGKTPKGLKQIQKAKKWCIVLFDFKYDRHAGIVWPDGLHFIHYDTDKRKICKNRLTEYPWRTFIEGFYVW